MADNFYKKIKEILENPPPFEADEKAIADLERRLDAAAKPASGPRYFHLAWMIPLLLLPFLLAGGFAYSKYKALNEKLDEVTRHLKLVTKDTQVHTYVTYHYDTIFRTIYKDVIVQKTEAPAPAPLWGSSLGSGGFHFNLGGYASPEFLRAGSESSVGLRFRAPQVWNPFVTPSTPASVSGSADSEMAEFSPHSIQKVASLPIRRVWWRAPRPAFVLGEKLNEPEMKYVHPKANPLLYFVPNGVNFGLNYQPRIYGRAWNHGYGGNGIGLVFGLNFPGGWTLQSGIERLYTTFEVKEADQFSNYPILGPNEPGDILKELYLDGSYWQVPFVFTKHFNKDGVLKPWFGIGVVANNAQKQRFKYEYKGATDDYELRQTFKSGTFSLNNLRANVGLSYALSDHFAFRLGLLYQRGLNKGPNEFFRFNQFSAQIGLNYSIGAY
ncbi:MAG: hypothetical protein D6714_07885 [Bacteroidetes bacterium]|nr:MAG: hypothetical protein D6714_07885 [Bacteroidota bacterium]